MELPATKTKVILAKTYHEDSGKIGVMSRFLNLDPWRPTETFLDGTIFQLNRDAKIFVTSHQLFLNPHKK